MVFLGGTGFRLYMAKFGRCSINRNRPGSSPDQVRAERAVEAEEALPGVEKYVLTGGLKCF
jgi:hypothetical protein